MLSRNLMAGLALPVALSACSQQEQATGPSTAGGAKTEETSAAPPQASGAARLGPSDQPVQHGGALRANVSPLHAAVSDLNVRNTEFGTVIDLSADALFDYDKSTLTPAAEAQLHKAAEVIRTTVTPGSIQIIGHTDSHGSDAYNNKLSEARAQTVADWFKQQPGVRQRVFTVLGKGKAEPLVPNETADGKDDPAGRAKNRRVEVVIPKAQP